MIESRKQWLTWGGILAKLLKSWTLLDQNSIYNLWNENTPRRQPALSKKDGLRCRVCATMDTYRWATWELWPALWELKQQQGLLIVAITAHFFDKLAENLDG